MKSVGSFLRLIPQLERRREAAGGSAAAVAPYDLLALKAKDTQLLIMLPALNRQTRKLKVRSQLSPSRLGTPNSPNLHSAQAHAPCDAAHEAFSVLVNCPTGLANRMSACCAPSYPPVCPADRFLGVPS